MRPEKEVKQYLKEKWSEYAHKFSGYSESSKLYSGNKKESWKEILTNALGTTETLTILDVGTGPGTMAFILTKLGHNVTGIDLSEGMVEKAMEHAIKFNLPVKFRQGDAENLPFGDESFDAVVNRHLLWTLPNQDKAIAEWSRVLKTGGRMVIIDGVWFDKSLKGRMKRFFAGLLILVTERYTPWKGYDSNMQKQLPFARETNRPTVDIAMLRNARMSAIDVMRDIDRSTQTWFYRLKYGAWGNQFLIKAIK